jgi:hypothetical protein
MLAAVAAGFAAACSRDITPDIEAIADRACACRDAACGRAALGDLVALAKQTSAPRGDEDRSRAAATKMAECLLAVGVTRAELVETIDRVKVSQ